MRAVPASADGRLPFPMDEPEYLPADIPREMPAESAQTMDFPARAPDHPKTALMPGISDER